VVELEPGAVAALAATALVYWQGARATGVGARTRAAFWTGLGVVAVALLSPVAVLAHDLLSAHMVQHLLLAFVAAPLLVAAHPGGALAAGLPARLRPGLAVAGRSGAVRLLAHPLVAWALFAAAGWGIHFSPLFDLALRNPAVHAAEHALFLGTGLLFWWPVAGGHPSGRRPLPDALRVLYVALAMPQNTFLALALSSASAPLYPTYVAAAAKRSWGPTPLDDQRQAAGIMWVAGDIALLVAVLVVAAAWGLREMRSDDADPVSPAATGRPPSPRTAG
jgi:cytochrome c oxidase assembly factor CtaG